MNKRIKELYAEAVMSVHEAFIDRMLVPSAIDLEFAELIVQECIQTIQMGITRDGHNTEQYLRSVKHIKQIKEHFGVTE